MREQATLAGGSSNLMGDVIAGTPPRRPMRWGTLVVLIVLSGCVGTPTPPESQEVPPPSAVVGAIGNSLMLGYNADYDHIESAPEISWSTGDKPWSFRSRAGARDVENVAAPGAGTAEFAEQIGLLEHATLVLVMLHDSAMCGPPSMRNERSFESELRAGTRELVARGMHPVLVTPPDIASLAEAARAKPPANDFLLNYGFGQECALEPGFGERQAAMIATILRVAEEEGARHDRGAVFRIRWTPEMVSDVDGFHPSPVGLEAIAAAVWDAYETAPPRGGSPGS